MSDITTDEASCIIEVAALCDFDEMDADDLDAAGNCAVDGAYRLRLTDAGEAADPKDLALDIFHHIVPIACLEDFDILIRLEKPSDSGTGWLRRDLGRQSAAVLEAPYGAESLMAEPSDDGPTA
ncbi:hypothetical protein [Defluviimonas salinarum]|uniref:Uncharacterized protein n=1 Tax=Defluviimonas salinarum TaxID=2992147 RepID=A0ABT3J896_9RHOB|nr:hypothetical protein [Defluviimonas salinarum]MCW3783913.1 hypothetical protein [Defluviimonas salinarum]